MRTLVYKPYGGEDVLVKVLEEERNAVEGVDGHMLSAGPKMSAALVRTVAHIRRAI